MSLRDLVATISSIEVAARRRSGAPRKLTEADAKAIYRDPASVRRIAKHRGLAPSTVSRIKRGLLWAHVTEAA